MQSKVFIIILIIWLGALYAQTADDTKCYIEETANPKNCLLCKTDNSTSANIVSYGLQVKINSFFCFGAEKRE